MTKTDKSKLLMFVLVDKKNKGVITKETALKTFRVHLTKEYDWVDRDKTVSYIVDTNAWGYVEFPFKKVA